MKKANVKQVGAMVTKFTSTLMTMVGDEHAQYLEKLSAEEAQNMIDMDTKELLDRVIGFINNGCGLEKIISNVFTIGEMFCKNNPASLKLGDNFQNWFVKPYLQRVVPIKSDMPKLWECRLATGMKDTSIQDIAGKPGCMPFDEFFSVISLLLFQPEVAKWILKYELSEHERYILHVTLDSKRFSVYLVSYNDEWIIDATGFDNTYKFHEGSRFLFFPTLIK